MRQGDGSLTRAAENRAAIATASSSDSIYRCACGGLEEVFRATNNDVPPSCHYCRHCADALAPEVREHLIPVVARSTQTTGPWRPA